MINVGIGSLDKFQSTLPAGEATTTCRRISLFTDDFNPRFPRGKRHGVMRLSFAPAYFNTRFPRGKRPRCDEAFLRSGLFQSTLPAGEATPAAVLDLVTRNFNPRFPRGKRQCPLISSLKFMRNFNPRFPRGKRHMHHRWNQRSRNFNPRFPRGKRQHLRCVLALVHVISIHASRGGSDRYDGNRRRLQMISIHASRGGSDVQKLYRYAVVYFYFNPRFPRGKRLIISRRFLLSLLFQSTLPAGEATVRSSCPLMTARSSMGSANRDFPVFLSAVSMLFFFWALGVRAYRIMVSLGSYPFFVPI